MNSATARSFRELETMNDLLRVAGHADLQMREVAGRMTPMPVILESPYAGDIGANTRYALACMQDSFKRGEAPLASHLLYAASGVLDDTKSAQRDAGISAGLVWGLFAARTVVYVDRGVSDGMKRGIRAAALCGRPIEMRRLFAVRLDQERIDIREIVRELGLESESPAPASPA